MEREPRQRCRDEQSTLAGKQVGSRRAMLRQRGGRPDLRSQGTRKTETGGRGRRSQLRPEWAVEYGRSKEALEGNMNGKRLL